MTPAARVQAAIDILDRVIEAARSKGAPADRIIADWARANRYAGSKDRRAVRELVYRAIRECGEVPRSGRAAMLALAQTDDGIAQGFDHSQYGPGAIQPDEAPAARGLAPAWLTERLGASGIEGEEAVALLSRAPLDLRVNTLKAARDTLELPVAAQPTAAPGGLRVEAGANVEQWEAWRDGLIEVQDTGSQIACMALAAQPGETVVDLCAGGGGKTLALAASMDNRGTLIACDTDRGRLSRLEPRTRRAGASGIATRLLDPGREMAALADLTGQADAVLVDAPCSGTGTWRRNPEARWRLDESELARLVALQAHILDYASGLVKPGGRLIYITCSLLDEEGSEQVTRFLKDHPAWRAERPVLPAGRPRGDGVRLTPLHDGTDGFFIAQLCLAC